MIFWMLSPGWGWVYHSTWTTVAPLQVFTSPQFSSLEVSDLESSGSCCLDSSTCAESHQHGRRGRVPREMLAVG